VDVHGHEEAKIRFCQYFSNVLTNWYFARNVTVLGRALDFRLVSADFIPFQSKDL
jgi:hypothetical protein